LQSIEEWSADNVVEWMAVLNLYRYAGVFKSKNIKGSDLINLDREKLLVSSFALTKPLNFFDTTCLYLQNMGIKDEFHQETILHCVRELILSCKADPLDTPIGGDSDPANGPAHRLLEHSFSKLERCSKCNKFLRGLQHQGFQCQGGRKSKLKLFK
jgi:SAM domain (Sterile alpha motif)